MRDFLIAIRMMPHKSGKSKRYVVFGLIFSTVLLSSCLNDDVQLPDQLLQGQINGEDWSYESANGYIESANANAIAYRLRFLSSQESASDPCTVPRPSLAHVSVIFIPRIGNFNVDQFAISENQVRATFELSPSRNLVASSGFMEVFDLTEGRVIGYLQVVLDDGNTVQGSFEARFCNF